MLTQRSEIREIERTSTSAKDAFSGIDENGDLEIDKREWDLIIDYIKILSKPSGFIAIKADSKGVLTDSAVIWMITKNIAEVPSPIFYKNRAYMVKDGGFITCVDAENGNVLYQTRIGNPGPQMATPYTFSDITESLRFSRLVMSSKLPVSTILKIISEPPRL
jgi:hypothetical protein